MRIPSPRPGGSTATLAAFLLVAAFGGGDADAQTSARFDLEESAFNAGGHPSDGAVPQSASFRLSLGALGHGVAGASLSSASFASDAGFAAAYPPPGEVVGLRFDDAQTLAWDPERSVGSYDVYRDALANLGGLGYGACLAGGLTAANLVDADLPPAAGGFFYLVTASNRLNEEGTKGFDGAGAERPNPSPCP